MFGLFLKNPLPKEAESMEIDLHLHHSRIVKTALIPSGVITFDRDEVNRLENLSIYTHTHHIFLPSKIRLILSF